MGSMSVNRELAEFLGGIAAQFGADDADRRGLWAERWPGDCALRALLREAPVPADAPLFDPHALVRRKARRDWEDRAVVGMLPDAVTRRGPLALDTEAFAGGSASALELIERRLAAVQAHAGDRAFIDVFANEARERAAELDAKRIEGDDLGRFAGATVAVKDLFDLAGRATRAGLRTLGRAPAERSATALSLLTDADAIAIGLANMHPLAYGTTGENPIFGRAHNPLVASALSGGSSSGSAVAVARGMASFALGTDTGGSIRIPAAACGIVGLKPTFGRISTTGVIPLARSLDHVGPLCLTAEDTALAFAMLADEPCPAAWSHWADLSGLRVGTVTTHFFDALDPAVAAAIENVKRALVSCGAEVGELDVPLMRYAGGAQWATLTTEAFETTGALVRELGDAVPADVRVRFEMGMFVAAADYVRAQRLRGMLVEALDRAFAEVDVLLTPALAMPVPDAGTATIELHGQRWPVTAAMSRLTNPLNVTGFPALAMPWGSDSRGLPIGIQLVGAPMDEVAILGTARVLERFLVNMGDAAIAAV